MSSSVGKFRSVAVAAAESLLMRKSERFIEPLLGSLAFTGATERPLLVNAALDYAEAVFAEQGRRRVSPLHYDATPEMPGGRVNDATLPMLRDRKAHIYMSTHKGGSSRSRSRRARSNSPQWPRWRLKFSAQTKEGSRLSHKTAVANIVRHRFDGPVRRER